MNSAATKQSLLQHRASCLHVPLVSTLFVSPGANDCQIRQNIFEYIEANGLHVVDNLVNATIVVCPRPGDPDLLTKWVAFLWGLCLCTHAALVGSLHTGSYVTYTAAAQSKERRNVLLTGSFKAEHGELSRALEDLCSRPSATWSVVDNDTWVSLVLKDNRLPAKQRRPMQAIALVGSTKVALLACSPFDLSIALSFM